tara:strand:- start:10570 stop:11208 length:639 start_codon:yes stop_codon:yes gene_type:complete
MSSWWDDFTGVFTQGLSGANVGTALAQGLGGLAIKEFGLSDPKVPVVGYQGSVPEYQAVRERVPMQPDPNRRPGSGGRRYFSDIVYADKPERQPMSVEQAQQKAQTQAQGLAALNRPQMAAGGAIGMNKGYYLGGITDGMADKIPARINGEQEARLSDGEFVIPADVVSHLGNGNSDAGANQLHQMMTRIRKERTGNPKQGKQIKPQKMLPA